MGELQREEESSAEVLPTREVRQEGLDALEGHEPAPS